MTAVKIFFICNQRIIPACLLCKSKCGIWIFIIKKLLKVSNILKNKKIKKLTEPIPFIQSDKRLIPIQL